MGIYHTSDLSILQVGFFFDDQPVNLPFWGKYLFFTLIYVCRIHLFPTRCASKSLTFAKKKKKRKKNQPTNQPVCA